MKRLDHGNRPLKSECMSSPVYMRISVLTLSSTSGGMARWLGKAELPDHGHQGTSPSARRFFADVAWIAQHQALLAERPEYRASLGPGESCAHGTHSFEQFTLILIEGVL